MTTAHVFIAASLDGFIARADGDIDWLLQRDAPAEDHGYNAFIADKDMIVMGRGCYEKTLTFDAWPYELPVLVMSRQLADTPVPQALAGKLRFSAQSPKAVMAELAQQGVCRVYLDGGQLLQSFLRDGLVADMVVTTVPVLIGAGRPLFGALAQDVDLKLIATRSFASGLVQSTYQVTP
jgi:dihydrofolate reductase